MTYFEVEESIKLAIRSNKPLGVKAMSHAILEQIPLFAELEVTELEKLAICLRTQFYKKDNAVVLETDSGSTLFIINRGKVKISRVSESGKEVMLAILSEGDFFGEYILIRWIRTFCRCHHAIRYRAFFIGTRRFSQTY